jgi:hypothetical protein
MRKLKAETVDISFSTMLGNDVFFSTNRDRVLGFFFTGI